MRLICFKKGWSASNRSWVVRMAKYLHQYRKLINRLVLILVSCVLTVAGAAQARTIITCGGSQGWGYSNMSAFPTWSQLDDGIPDGSTTLVSMPGTQELDILFQDALGMNSARSNDATIVLLGEEDGILNVLAVYRSMSGVTVENYVFDTNQKVMFVTTTRTLEASSILQSKASIRWANCR